MIKTFIISELKKWAREPLTRFILFYPLLFGLIGRFLLPYIEDQTGFVIEMYADVVIAVFALMMPMIFGALIGFSILDDRDDNVLMTVKVTPLGLQRFFAFRLIMIFIFAILASIFVILFADIGGLELYEVIAISVVSALSAPLTGLFINSFASNKIEGFAIMKGFGVLIFVPLVSLFVFDFKELFFAFAPGFFPAKAVSALIRGDQFMYLSFNSYYLLGWVYGIIMNIVAYRYFSKKL
ncbi:ABC transporter permease [Halonatronomonas betaini]|nr:ABC transporter permease [Halonatronomonas betaini]